MKNSSLIFSKGILNIPFLKQFLVDENIVPFSFFNNGSKINRVIGWGLKPTADRARKYAAKHHLPYIALEDGFLRSLGLGINKYPTFSLVYDDLGIYYDTTKPSRLEMLILNFEANEKQLKEAEKAKNLIVQYQLSKYNHALDFVHECSNHRRIVLVIDQTFGDMAVHYGQANEQDFQYMLQSAVDENPEAEIWVKTHPDVLSKKKQGYLTTIAQHQRVTLLAKDVNPMSLLAYADTVYCVTSQMGFEALLLNKKVVTFGVPWFAGWGLTDDRHPQVSTLIAQHRRKPRSLLTLFCAAYLQYSRYLNPYTNKSGNIFDVIRYLHQTKVLNQLLQGNLYCYGMSWWKQAVIKPFFNFPQCKLHFIRSLHQLDNRDKSQHCRLLIWGQGNPNVLSYAQAHQIPILRMEDGFLRSVGLGSNLVAPLSLVIDDLGIYFNAEQPSRLENILQHISLSQEDKKLAQNLHKKLIKTKLTKYNVGKNKNFFVTTKKRKILVPGQVEDDASIKYGSPRIKRNLDLIKQVRKNNPDAFIIYKPHPDIESKNRQGKIKREDTLQYADQIVDNANIIDCIHQVDEVHTMTSLAGFEALLRNKKVVCYGLPFYSNWGLTTDILQLKRRQRKLTLYELIIGVLVYYPQYIDHHSQKMINIETAIELLIKQKQQLKGNGLYRHWLRKQFSKLLHLYKTIR